MRGTQVLVHKLAVDPAGIKPNAHAYSAIMFLYQKAGQWQQAVQIFRDMLRPLLKHFCGGAKHKHGV